MTENTKLATLHYKASKGDHCEVCKAVVNFKGENAYHFARTDALSVFLSPPEGYKNCAPSKSGGNKVISAPVAPKLPANGNLPF